MARTRRTKRTKRTKTAGPGPRRWAWRWRSNPLRRRSDAVEAWIVLGTWLFTVLGAVFAGVLAAVVVDHTLAERRAQVHAVSAVLTRSAADSVPAASGYDDGRVWATVRWTDKDGSVHQDRVKVVPGVDKGSRITVWADRADRAVSKPLTPAESMLQAAVTGVLVAPVAAVTVWAAGRLVCGRLMRRRLAEWDEEWKRIGPQWRNLSGGRG